MLSLQKKLQSVDGSIKYSFLTSKGHLIETMYFRLPFQTTEGYCYTICISSQAGCALNCSFCATGMKGFFSNLAQDELSEQVSLVRDDLLQKNLQSPDDRFHLAFMGMGEPFLNYENVMLFSARAEHTFSNLNKISLSTVGIVPRIKELTASDRNDIDLFVSVHSPYDEQRDFFIPVNRKYPLAQLMESCYEFSRSKNKFVNASYLLIDNFNDTATHAHAMCQLLDPAYFRMQILLYNDVHHASFKRPTPEAVSQFADIVKTYGIDFMIIESKGRDINGGCGQLA